VAGCEPHEADRVVDVREIHAAGGVVWRPVPGDFGPDDPQRPPGGGRACDDVEIVLVHRPRHRDWSLPKGKLIPGEAPLAAACREVLEETGVHAAPQYHLARVRYRVPVRGGHAVKVVDYWAMRAGPTEPFIPNDEIDGIRWIRVGLAGGLLSYPRDAAVVADFAARPRVTGVVTAADVARWTSGT
jgi:8-oxo-dGTP diphosphatase